MPCLKSNVAALVACSLLGLTGCNDDADLPVQQVDAGADAGALQPVTLRFKAKVGNEDLVCGRAFAGQGANKATITPEDFRFFVQEAYLLDEAGKEVRVAFDDGLPFQTKDVALIDFTDELGNCGGVGGPTVNLTITGKVPPGRYHGVVFVNGVPESLNHGDPVGHPSVLRVAAGPSAHWGWMSGYRFIMAEVAPVASGMDGGVHVPTGSADAGTADAGVGGHGGMPGGPSAVHTGSTACGGTLATSITCAKPNRNRVVLRDFDPTTQTIVADLGAVFAGIDLSMGSQCHGTGVTCPSGFAALGIDIESGQPAATQTVFHVE